MSLENKEAVKPVVNPGAYVVVFAALLALTAGTVGLSYVDLGNWHSALGLTIAAIKALLILLFFMHVLHGKRLVWVIALSGLFWLGILISLTLTDYATRSWLT
jgi:cytochrome c oxidase subunit IV